jgi:superfamily II helicase
MSHNKKDLDEEFKTLLIDELRTLSSIQKETSECFVQLDKKLDLHIQKTQHELEKINTLDLHQNDLLDQHIRGVNTIKDMHVSHREETKQQIEIMSQKLDLQRQETVARLETLEKPYDLVKYAGKVLTWVGAIAGSLYAILKLMEIL